MNVEMQDAPQPTLQRLLVLDKSFDSLESRIEEAARILQIQLGDSKREEPLGASDHRNEPSSGYGRHDFVLRWILEKLKTQKEARSSTAAWCLLYNVVRDLPTLNVTRSPRAFDMMGIVVDALEELFPSYTIGSAPIAETAPDGASQEASSTPSSDKKSKKRKRVEKTTDEQAAAQMKQIQRMTGERLKIFASIAQLVSSLVVRCQPSSGDSTSRKQMQAILGVDRSRSTSFMKHWLHGVIVFFEDCVRASGDRKVLHNFVSTHLQIMLDVWKLQPVTPIAERQSLVRFFSKDCLWPSFLLLALLRSDLHGSDDEEKPVKAVSQLERLISHQVLLPTRPLLNNRAMQERHGHNVQVRNDPLAPIDVLAVLDSEITTLDALSNPSMADTHNRMVAVKGLFHIFELAFRYCDLSNPIRKRHEMAWIDQVFQALTKSSCSSLIGITAHHLDIRNVAVFRMLEIVLDHNVSLGRDALISLLDIHCYPNSQGRDRPDFVTIGQIIAMDPDIFNDRPDQAEKLFDNLSSVARIELLKDANDDDTHKFAEQTVRQDVWVNQVAVPLMKAFARTRNLITFLTSWLEHLAREPAWRKNEWYIWTDKSLQLELSGLLENALSTDQIANLLMSLQSEVTGAKETFLEGKADERQSQKTLDRAYATVSLLNAVVGAIRADDNVDSLTLQLQALTKEVESLLVLLSQNSEGLQQDEIWSLLTRLYELWFPRWMMATATTGDVTNEAVVLGHSTEDIAWTTLEADPYRRQSDKEETSAMVLRARRHKKQADSIFHFLLLVCDLQRCLPDRAQQIHRTLARMVESQNTEGVKDTDGYRASDYRAPAVKHLESFVRATSRYPNIWGLLSTGVRAGIFESLVRKILFEAPTYIPYGHMRIEMAWKALILSIFADCNAEVRNHTYEALFQEETWPNMRRGQFWLVDVFSEDLILASVTREQRERLVDWVASPGGVPPNAEDDEHFRSFLSLLVKLTELQCNGATLINDPPSLWKVAGYARPPENGRNVDLMMFEQIVHNVLRQALVDQEHERRETYARQFSKQIIAFTTRSSDISLTEIPLICTFVTMAETTLGEAGLAKLPHCSPTHVDSFAKLVYQYAHTLAALDVDLVLPNLMSLSKIPTAYWHRGGSTARRYFGKLQHQIQKASSLTRSDDDEWRYSSVAQRQLYIEQSSQNQSLSDMADLAIGLTSHDLKACNYQSLEDTFTATLHKASDAEKISLIDRLTEEPSAEKTIFANLTLTALKRSALDDEDLKSKAKSFLPRIWSRLASTSDDREHGALVECMLTILQEKHFLVNQFSVEMILSTIYRLTTNASPELDSKGSSLLFFDLILIARALLQFHRASIGGRLHLVTPVLKQLMACLFIPQTGSRSADVFNHPSWLNTSKRPLNKQHAARFARLLTLLCNPPQSTISRRRSTGAGLVDETREVRKHVGTHMQYLLHSYCTMQLHGRLGDGVKDALGAGIHAVMDVMDIAGEKEELLKTLSASMSNSERAILRREVEDWKKFGTWKRR